MSKRCDLKLTRLAFERAAFGLPRIPTRISTPLPELHAQFYEIANALFDLEIGTDISADLSRVRRVICAHSLLPNCGSHSCYSERSAVTGFTTAALRDGK